MQQKIGFFLLRDIIMLLLATTIFILLGTSFIDLGMLTYGDFLIPIKIIVSLILYFSIILLKNNNVLKMIIMLERYDITVFTSMIIYRIVPILFIILFMNLGLIPVIFAYVIIILELLIYFTNIYLVLNKKITRDLLGINILREHLFNLLIITLIIYNYPFAINNIALNMIIIVIYIVLQINTLFIYFKK